MFLLLLCGQSLPRASGWCVVRRRGSACSVAEVEGAEVEGTEGAEVEGPRSRCTGQGAEVECPTSRGRSVSIRLGIQLKTFLGINLEAGLGSGGG